ncbi:ribonuclease E/G [Planctomycetota bacterium]
MTRSMLINVAEPEEARVAVVEDKKLEELYIERDTSSKLLGNIYKGRVVSVEPSIQAAFVDFGVDKNGFLHVSDVMPAYGRAVGNEGESRELQSLLRVGQEVLVQVSKEEIGSKAPTLTTFISLPGRYLVLMPSVNKRGVSKKIGDERERRRLRAFLNRIDLPGSMGCIVRTAGADRIRNDLIRDLNYLLNLWKAITGRVRTVDSPVLIYCESDLVLRSIRDYFDTDIEQVVVDDEDAHGTAVRFLQEVMPKYAERVVAYDEGEPLFHRWQVEEQIERLYDRSVALPSGGSIVIEQTEALVAIDVNSGKFKENDNLEETALQTNLEAAREVCRQLRLRDMGGVICIDFIDMRSDAHRYRVESVVRDLLGRDRARTRVARMSRFCILELTRQRVRMSIRTTHYESCAACGGTGSIKSVESMALWTVRQLRARVAKRPLQKRLEVRLHPEVKSYLTSKKRDALREIESRAGQPVVLKADRGLRIEELKVK